MAETDERDFVWGETFNYVVHGDVGWAADEDALVEVEKLED